MLQDVPFKKIKTIDDLKKYDSLYKEVLNIAQFESEVQLGVNPKSLDQADVTLLSDNDSHYIDQVYKLVATLLNDSNWIIKTVKKIEKRFLASPDSIKGVKFNDEIFKSNKGILEEYLKEKSKKKR
jgi:hypothetical protein